MEKITSDLVDNSTIGEQHPRLISFCLWALFLLKALKMSVNLQLDLQNGESYYSSRPLQSFANYLPWKRFILL